MASLLYCELLKLRRSKTLLISFLGALVSPLLIFISRMGMHISDPTRIITMAEYYDDDLMISMLMFGLIVYVVIAGCHFSREYTENTLKTILAIPVQRSMFIISKFVMLFVWVMFMTLAAWLGTTALAALHHAIQGLSEFSFTVAFDYFNKMIFGGALVFLTLSPFCFLSIFCFEYCVF